MSKKPKKSAPDIPAPQNTAESPPRREPAASGADTDYWGEYGLRINGQPVTRIIKDSYM